MRFVKVAAGACVGALVLAGCGSNKGGGNDQGSGGKLVDGATFTMALSADPGNLDPQGSADGNLVQISAFAYDHLVNITNSGKIVSGLASKWVVDGSTITLTMHAGITCSDGSAFTAADAAANLNYVVDPANKSPYGSTFLPPGAKATANADTVTVTSPKATPFPLNGLSQIPMVCAKGMHDRSTLASKTDGTGPYELSAAAPGTQYTFTRRSGYTWGPGGVSTSTKGLPAKVVVKIVQNETTAANLLLSGGLNAAAVVGPDSQRLQAAHLFAATTSVAFGEMWFNQATGRPTADKSVRLAITQALDLAQLRKVLTSGNGSTPTQLADAPPAACTGDSVSAALPQHDLDAAGKLLDSAGWVKGANGMRSKNGTPLTLHLNYLTGYGSGTQAAAELAAQQLKALGAKVTITGQDNAALVQNVFGAGNWDIAWLPVGVHSPDQLVPFASGPNPPSGNNFAHIDDPAYNAIVAKASTVVGTAGCSQWLQGDAALIRDADVIPFANSVTSVFGKGATFDFVSGLIPTSIRMHAG
jgi:peptide/nickel transport system substrate-binding protein